jgi:hypothetical protein
MVSNDNSRAAERIFKRLKGLRERMQPGEVPLLNIPGIWDGGQEGRSMGGDIVLTNQRLMGYVFKTFPRERLFLESVPLTEITAVSLRHKTHEPLFRELLVRGDRERKVYIRSSRRHTDMLYDTLRSAIEEYAPQAQNAAVYEEDQEEATAATQPAPAAPPHAPAPVYGRQDIRTAFEDSPLAITLLLVGGLALEVIGILLWVATHSTATGGPLFFAGLLCVIFAIIVKRQQRR